MSTQPQKKLLEGVAVFWSRDLITLFMQVICTVITFRVLKVEEYGRLTLLLSAYGMFSFFVDFGGADTFTSEMAIHIGRNQYGEAKFLAFAFLRFMAVTTLGTIVVLVVIVRVGIFSFAVHTNLLLALCLYMLLTPLLRFYCFIFYGNVQYIQAGLLGLFMTAGRVPFLLAVLIISRIKQLDMVFMVFMSYPVGLLLSLLILFRPLQRNLGPILRTPLTHKSGMGRALAKLVGFNSLSTFFKRLHDESSYWVINFILGERATGLYGAAIKTSIVFQSFPQAVEAVSFPLIAQYSQDRKQIGNLFRKTVKYNLWLALFIIVVVWVFSSLIIDILAGTQYHQAAMLLKIVILTLVPRSIFQGLRSTVFALRFQSSLFIVHLISACLIVTFNIVGLSIIKHVNFSGIALVLAIVIMCLLMLYMLSKREKGILKELWTGFRNDIFNFKELALALKTKKQKVNNLPLIRRNALPF